MLFECETFGVELYQSIDVLSDEPLHDWLYPVVKGRPQLVM